MDSASLETRCQMFKFKHFKDSAVSYVIENKSFEFNITYRCVIDYKACRRKHGTFEIFGTTLLMVMNKRTKLMQFYAFLSSLPYLRAVSLDKHN